MRRFLPRQTLKYQALATQMLTFADGVNRVTSNTNTANFTASGGDFGSITHVGLFDTQTGGDLLWQGPAEPDPKLGENGDTLVIQSGAITITVN